MFIITKSNTKERLTPLSKTTVLSQKSLKTNCKNTSSNEFSGCLSPKRAKNALSLYSYGRGKPSDRGAKNDAS